MESTGNLLIVVDAGHGGWDNGAGFEGRRESVDNLNLALAVQRELQSQGIRVLMTRTTDDYVTLQDRAAMANEAGADLFVSLHRNSYTEQTPSTNGVENFIYLTAPEETAGRAAQLVLDEVVDVGVQSNRGVKRGNYYVLRRTNMPAMLLEMGYIINDIDNQLFDEHLEEYAVAIAKGVMRYFGLTYQGVPGVTPVPLPSPPPSPAGPPPNGPAEVVALVNRRLGTNIMTGDVYDMDMMRGMTRALQTALNMDFGAGLTVDGLLGPATLEAYPNVRQGQSGNVVFVIQALLRLNGYNPGPLDGHFGPRTRSAALMFQRDKYLIADGVVGDITISQLLR